MTASPSVGPLAGVRIVDFTLFLSGPFATQILGDLGAEVIKVEAPDGDMSRSVPPRFVDGSSTYFGSTNRNKKSLMLDMRTPEGLAIARQLIGEADAVVENFRPGKLAHLGINAATERARKPSLVWASISGFGQDGPLRDRPAYDMIVQAMSGVMSMTGEPGREPVRAGVPIGDLCAGLYAVIGLLSSLLEARRTGVGRDVEVSMLDVQVALLTYQAASYLQGGEVPGLQGSAHDFIPSYRCFRAGDGKVIAVTANTENMFRGLVRVLGLGDLANDPRFKDGKSRYKNRETLINLLNTEFARSSSGDLIERLVAAEVPAAAVDDLEAVFNNPQVLHRGMRLKLHGPSPDQRLEVAGDPMKFNPPGRTVHSFPPRLGEHNGEILARLKQAVA
ncbi:CoA transferase [Ramlibacter henchirensis]|uniref:CoA transferase n=1 Tax=Ramlibacter henchirensis TaxID=204072 RepID=A0A4Z0BYF4_9BURK|nr:CoA transferase [Ramlibacter henchirensis]TFZ02959.1 CoA transferase [Ramlibacter henchirensis]